MARKTKVLCVDDSEDIARLLNLSISREADLEGVGSLGDAENLVSEVARTGAEVVVLDLTMPGKDPLEMVRALIETHPRVRVVVFSGYDGREVVESAKDAGAWAYVSKHDDIASLVQTIRKVAAGEVVFPR